MRTVGGRAAHGAPTVRANPLKSNGGTAADGADANLPPQSAPEETRARRLEGAAMSAAEALKAARAAGISSSIDGDDLGVEGKDNSEIRTGSRSSRMPRSQNYSGVASASAFQFRLWTRQETG